MVVPVHSVIIDNSAVKIKSRTKQCVCSFGIFHTFSCCAHNSDNLTSHILGNIVAIGTGVCNELLLIQILCSFKGLFGCKSVHSVGFLLERCKAMEKRSVCVLFLCYGRKDIYTLACAFHPCIFRFILCGILCFGNSSVWHFKAVCGIFAER